MKQSRHGIFKPCFIFIGQLDISKSIMNNIRRRYNLKTISKYELTIFLFSLIFIQSVVLINNSINAQIPCNEPEPCASNYLNRFLTNPDKFIQSWRLAEIGLNNIEDFAEIHLKNPYKIYGVHYSSILLTTDLSDFKHYSSFWGYGFPVYYKDIYVGTIKVAYISEEIAKATNLKIGSYSVTGRELADQAQDEQVVNVQNKMVDNNYEVSVLDILFGLGRYIILVKDGKIKRIAPTKYFCAEWLSVTQQEDGSYPFVAITDAEPKLKNMAEQYNKNTNK